MIYYKTFLTDKDDGGGSVNWNLETEYNKESRFPISVQSCLKITDCFRKIELDFWAGNKKQHEEMLDKIDTLIDSLQKYRHAYSKAWAKPKVKYF